MAEFKPIEPFGIDNGELDGLTPQEIFVLGYELAEISSLASLDIEGFQRPVHAANKDRLERALQKRDRSYRIDWMPDDQSEAWMNLVVAPKGFDFDFPEAEL